MVRILALRRLIGDLAYDALGTAVVGLGDYIPPPNRDKGGSCGVAAFIASRWTLSKYVLLACEVLAESVSRLRPGEVF